MPRAREIGIGIGVLPTGHTNSVLDVDGVGLGHTTVVRDEGPPPEGRGVARTGVTTLVLAEDAYTRPLAAGGAVLNGAGECTGFLTAGEWGTAETPVYLTSTMQLGRVYDAACQIALEGDERVADDIVIPVVGECDDSFLNDCRRMQLTADDVRASHRSALSSRGATTPPDEGAVGAGTGMSCLGHKGGIGTASRVTPAGHTVAVLLLTNFGEHGQLTVDGVPVGRLLPDPEAAPERPAGSCIGIVVTDAPINGAECARVARRIGLGLARTGTVTLDAPALRAAPGRSPHSSRGSSHTSRWTGCRTGAATTSTTCCTWRWSTVSSGPRRWRSWRVRRRSSAVPGSSRGCSAPPPPTPTSRGVRP